MKTWKFTYWFEESDWFEWETEITAEEEAVIKDSIEKGVLLDDVDALSNLLTKVYAEIREATAEDNPFIEEDEDPCEGLTVHFQDPNEPFYTSL